MKENTWPSEKEVQIWEEMEKPVLPGYACVGPAGSVVRQERAMRMGGRPAYLTGGRGLKGTAGSGDRIRVTFFLAWNYFRMSYFSSFQGGSSTGFQPPVGICSRREAKPLPTTSFFLSKVIWAHGRFSRASGLRWTQAPGAVSGPLRLPVHCCLASWRKWFRFLGSCLKV